MAKQHQTLAAIDIGTNSLHLVVVAIDTKTTRFKILDRVREIVRLGTGTTDMKYLSVSAINRAIETLKRFKIIADLNDAPIRAIATSAVREALNQSEFIRRVKNEANIRVEIASGVEEARLIYLGVLQALPVFNKKILLIDIGGGSTEFLVGEKRNISYDNSIKIGAVRLTQRFFPSGSVSMKAARECREYISLIINPIVRILRESDFETVVGTSGTILNIAKMIQIEIQQKDSEDRTAAGLNNFSFSREELDAVVKMILSAKNVKDRAKIKGLDPGRADIITAGCLILDQIFRELKLKSITVSEYALREGIILDTLEQKFRQKSADPHLNDIRYDSVLHLAENLGYEKQHSHQVTALALRIFDQTRKLHHLGVKEREYLEAASILHDVGLFLSHSQHHRHTYYFIRNAELLGFTESEKEIIANIARYHRKSHPKDKHENFQKLNTEDQIVVGKLSAILRIADGLDRTHTSSIADIICNANDGSMIFRLKRVNSTSIHMDIMGATAKAGLFEEIFTLRVKFVQA